MPITAASIEANGWVLRLTFTGSLGSFASYTLDSGSTPRVLLATSHGGFVKSAGTAVAGTIVRNLIGTKPLRNPANWNGASLDPAVIDETDLGGGSIRVRIALSEHVYATDTALTLAVLAGWRTGESAASGVGVTNNSSIVAPIPIMRWALLPYQVTTSAFTVSMVVASHHPVGFEPVAGIKFTATDGTTVKTVWATALSTDNSYGDNLRCYSVSFDPASATAFTTGLLRVDAEIYPWLGSIRTTDAAGTRSMATLRADGFSVNAASPWAIAYDPAGSRYGTQFVFLDPVNGTVTASAGMVATTLAGAKAVAAASRARDVSTAVQAGYLANRTLPVANGQASQTRSIDGMQIVLPAGNNAYGSTVVTSGLANPEIPIKIIGDPADSNPRANCILPTSTFGVPRANRILYQNMTLEIGVTIISNGTVLLDNCEVRGRSGQESSAVAPFGGAPAGQWALGLARSKWWKTAAILGGGNMTPAFVRACEHSRTVSRAVFAVKNRFIPGTEDSFVGSTSVGAYLPWTSATEAGQVEDTICAYNDLRKLRGRAWGAGQLSAATAGTPNPSNRRNVFMGNVVERIGGDSQPFYSVGEGIFATMSYNIIEGNSFVGDRCNTFYSDPTPRITTVRGDTGVSANAIQSTAHGQTNGTQVRYYTKLSAPTIPGLTNGATYFIVNATANSFQLALTAGGTPLAITTQASTINGQTFGNLTDCDTILSQAFVNRVANNAFDWMPTKQDDYNDSGFAEIRGTANGYRPQMIEAWSMLYGVGHEGNVDTRRQGTSLFTLEYTGARSIDGYAGALAPLYTDDKSILGPSGGAAVGGGNYLPQSGSPLAGRAQRGNADVDANGLARVVPSAAGAFQLLPVMLTPANAQSLQRAAMAAAMPELAPASAGSASRATASTVVKWETLVADGARHSLFGDASLSWTGALLPAGSISGQRTAATMIEPLLAPAPAASAMQGATALIGWAGAISADGGAMAHRVAAAQLGIDFTLQPEILISAVRSSAPTLVATGSAALQPASTIFTAQASMPLLLRSGTVANATVVVGADPRMLFPNRN